MGDFSPVVTTYQDLPHGEKVPTELPPKEDLCRQWFDSHPNDIKRTGRELSDSVKPFDVKISHVTWNKVKKEYQ